MVNTVMDFITSYDKEVGEAIQAECGRQRRNLDDGYGNCTDQ